MRSSIKTGITVVSFIVAVVIVLMVLYSIAGLFSASLKDQLAISDVISAGTLSVSALALTFLGFVLVLRQQSIEGTKKTFDLYTSIALVLFCLIPLSVLDAFLGLSFRVLKFPLLVSSAFVLLLIIAEILIIASSLIVRIALQ
jgi:hypothetical protein